MITIIGDLVVDILVSKEEMNYGTDTDADINFRSGGQGNNVATFIKREDVDCQLIGNVGDDPFGRYLIEKTEEKDIISKISTDSNGKTGTIILMIDSNDGQRSMITDRGANLNLSDDKIKGVEDSDLLYLSGYSLFSEKTRKSAITAKQIAMENNIPVALDPSSTYFLKDGKDNFLNFLKGVTFFFPNYDEGSLLTGKTKSDEILKELKKYVKVPVLTLGEKGCAVFIDEQYTFIEADSVEVVDTTAAGDSFAGAFLAAYCKTEDIRSSANHALKVGSNTVTYFGALPDV